MEPTAQRRLRHVAQHLTSQSQQPHAQLAPLGTISRADYVSMHEESLNQPERFWARAAEGIDWVKPYQRLLNDDRKPFYRWFTGGQLSVCHNCVDRHLAARAQQAAILYESPLTKTSSAISFAELHMAVSRVAGALLKLGASAGERVIVYMPMIPEAIFAMLGCARVGAVHSVVFGGFAAPELAARIDDAAPVAMLAATCGVEPTRIVEYMPLLERAIELAAASARPRGVLVKQREMCRVPLTAGRYDWDEALAAATPAEAIAVDSNHPLYILYTSGSTGKPKGVVRDSAPHAVALCWSMPNFMRTKPGEVYWAASDVGWVVGHSYIVYGPLLNGSSTVLYEGKPVGTPDAAAFWRIMARHSVRGFFTAPTALRAIRKEDPSLALMKQHDLSSLRGFFVAGERCDPATAQAYTAALGMDIVDNWWQTETGWPICGFQDDALGMRPGSTSLPFPGYRIEVLNDEGRPLPAGSVGTIAVRLPLPPSCFPTLWNNDEGYVENYLAQYPGYYATGDAGVVDADGYVTVLERIDDVINVAAHRLSTGSIEAVVKAHAGVSDAAVVGTLDEQKGQVPIALVVLGDGAPAGALESIKAAVRGQIGAIASLAGVAPVEQLPKTRSGKVLRKNIRGLADGRAVPVPGTIENPQALDMVSEALRTIGYPKAAK